MHEIRLTVHASLDIAQASLQRHLQNQSYDLPSPAGGHAQPLKRLATVPGVHVVCEATGGYGRAVVAALTAVMQKLIVFMNHLPKTPLFPCSLNTVAGLEDKIPLGFGF